jgi:hypothetical protein
MRGKEMKGDGEKERMGQDSRGYKNNIGKECKQGMERTKDKENERIGMENNVRNRSVDGPLS